MEINRMINGVVYPISLNQVVEIVMPCKTRTTSILSVDYASIPDLDHKDYHHIILNCEDDSKPPYSIGVSRNVLVSLLFYV